MARFLTLSFFLFLCLLCYPNVIPVKNIEELNNAKNQSMAIIEKANQRAADIIGQSEIDAHNKAKQILAAAQEEILQKQAKLKEELRKEVSNIAVLGAERILKNKMDLKVQNDLLSDLIGSL